MLKDTLDGFSHTERLGMVAKELNIAGMFVTNEENWRRQRTLVMHAFNPAHVKSYFPALQTVTTRLLHRWIQQAGKSASFELEPDLMRYTLDVTAGLAFGTDINTIKSKGPVIQNNLGDIFACFKSVCSPLFHIGTRLSWQRIADLMKTLGSLASLYKSSSA